MCGLMMPQMWFKSDLVLTLWKSLIWVKWSEPRHAPHDTENVTTPGPHPIHIFLYWLHFYIHCIFDKTIYISCLKLDSKFWVKIISDCITEFPSSNPCLRCICQQQGCANCYKCTYSQTTTLSSAQLHLLDSEEKYPRIPLSCKKQSCM